jgi:hypothetical protein
VTSSVGARRFRDTPARLALQRNLLSALIVGWAVATIAVLGILRTQANRVDEAASQVQAVQETKVQLTRADSLATTGYLSGGLQSDAALASFAQDMAAANTGLATISRGVGGDRAAASLQLINSYLTSVTAAQANNRQGWPVGATYQKSASESLRSEILPSLDSVDRSARSSLVASTRALGWSWLVPTLFALLVAIPLALALAVLAARTNRLINLPMALGLVVAFAGFLLASSVSGAAKSDTVRGVQTVFRDRDLTGQARVALYNAKSAEALTLIARGSGQPYELQWRQSMSDLRAAISASPRLGNDVLVGSGLATYTKNHETVRSLDDAGNWDEARLGVLPAAGEVSAASFNTLDTALSNASTGDVVPADVGRSLRLAQVIVGLAALAAAALVRAGLAQRLKEYQ